MADSLESVNATARLLRKWAVEPNDNINASSRAYWATSADAIDAILAELTQLRAWCRPVPASYGDLSDLPKELIAQLSGVKTDELEDQVFTVVKAAGNHIELDKLLIELYRRFGVIHQRRFMINKCYRMAQKGLIYIVTGRKGVYSVNPQSDLESNALPEPLNGSHSGPKETFNPDLDDEIEF